MYPFPTAKRLTGLAAVAFVAFPLTALVLFLSASGEAADQKPRAKKDERKEKPKTPAKSAKKAEVEDTEADLDETASIDLEAEAGTAPAGPMQDLLKSLSVPHDDLKTPSGRVDRIEPLPRYIGDAPDFSGTITVTRIGPNGKRLKLKPITKRDVGSVAPYEEIVLREVNAFLEKKAQPRTDALLAAEKALVFALRFHAAERKGKADHARQWSKLDEGIRLKWIEVRRERAAALADADRWDDAFRLADRLARDKDNLKLLKTLQAQINVQLDLPRLALLKAEKTGKLEDYTLARERLGTFDTRFPSSSEGETVRKGLKTRASELMKEGLELAKTDKSGAIDKLREATKVWPELDGLQESLRTLDDEHPVLYVGVAALPKAFSPALAFTDSEKQAVELLFDSLVKRVPDGQGVWTYRPSLALGRARVIPLGREMYLDDAAKWSDGRRLSAADVRHTVSLLKDRDLLGRNTAWADLLDDPRVEGAPNQLRLTLRNGFLDPLSLMTFKVLPREWGKGKALKKADDPAFAASPLGSGPFFLDKEAKRDTPCVVFTASPHYQERARRTGRPSIHEIRFLVAQNPVQEMTARPTRLHLLLDLPTTRVKELIDGGFPPRSIVTTLPQRVYFLAVNHAVEALQNQDLRKAIAHAIDREAILQKFRVRFVGLDSRNLLSTQLAPEDEKLHPALNGPYPIGSWALNPTVKSSLYDLDLARTKANDALKKLGDVTLKLKFPSDDPRAEEACKAIAAQVARLGGKIKIEPMGVAPHDLRDIIFERKYELAYCHLDYSSDSYWLWPLFDPSRKARDPGGSNFLRYENDDQLDSLFGRAMNRRDFTEIRKVTHEIHAHMYDKMPLIPLWQLHAHIAVHPQLKTGDLDPLNVFARVEDWKLQK